jgi:uncharacterized protein YbjT (DUF2867 family)
MNISKTFLILGGTGMVGQKLLAQSLVSKQVAHIVAPTRKPLVAHKKLSNPIIDFNDLPGSAEWWKADAVLCVLGTTIKQAGNKQQFRHVDYDYVMRVAQLARSAGTSCFVLNSSLGADANSSSFYLKVKGELECDLRALKFASLTIIRPSLLDAGKRPERRLGEQIGLWLSNRLSVFIPKRYLPISTENVARAMLSSALEAKPGLQIIESENLH